MPHRAERSLYGGVFKVPAVPKGAAPVLIPVADHVQMEKLPHIMGGGNMPRRILGESIAADVVREWAHSGMGMNTACGPGIWVVRDVMPLVNPDGTLVLDVEKHAQFRPATDEEKARMWAEDMVEQTSRQEAWGAYLKEQGDILDADPDRKKGILISPTMRAGAAYYGYSAPWLENTRKRVGDMKTCQFCSRDIPSSTVKCHLCNEVVDRKRYEELKKQPAVA